MPILLNDVKIEKLGKELGTFKYRVSYKNQSAEIADPNPELSADTIMFVIDKLYRSWLEEAKN